MAASRDDGERVALAIAVVEHLDDVSIGALLHDLATAGAVSPLVAGKQAHPAFTQHVVLVGRSVFRHAADREEPRHVEDLQAGRWESWWVCSQ